MKYKVGDKVRVKDCMKGGVLYGNVYFIKEMEEYKGKDFPIVELVNGYGYKLDNAGGWNFSDEMLEPAEIAPVKKSHKPQFTTDKTRGFKSIYIDGITIAIPIETIVGIAYKNPADEYDEERGKSLAYYRMEGQECEI